MMPDQVAIRVDETRTVSGLMQMPQRAVACIVLAHGAGAGMTHPFMTAVADGLAQRDIATLRFQFPYMENGSKRPDRPALAHASVRAAVETARCLAPGLPLFAGGKSFGGRMTSQTQAEAPLTGIRGLLFWGFPLHPANKASDQRGIHLNDVGIPMLFLQGSRDALADPGLLGALITRLPRATLKLLDHADHSFHVQVRSGATDRQVLNQSINEAARWIQGILRDPADR